MSSSSSMSGAAYLVSLTCDGGVPLFTRKHGDLKQIPFPLLASLNGVALFGESHDVSLLSTDVTEADCRLIWRDYHASVRLVLVAPSGDSLSSLHLHRVLDHVFQSMVLVAGLDDLVAQRNVDRLKRDLRSAFSVIDALLSTLSPTGGASTSSSSSSGASSELFGSTVGAADCVAFPEANLIQNFLDGYVESVDSTYGCVLLRGRVVAATKNWYSLHPDEVNLLSLVVTTDAWATLKDTPVFLPVKSPTVPFRLVSSELTGAAPGAAGVTVCVLCGPSPSLVEIETELLRNWKTTYNLIASLQSLHPRGFPAQANFDHNLLGFIFINLERRRALSSMAPAPTGNNSAQRRQMDPGRRMDALRSFYRSTVGAVFPDTFVPTPHAVDQNGDLVTTNVTHVELSHPATESYMAFETHTCVAVAHAQYQLFALFPPAVPNHSMRSVAHRTLHLLAKEKTFNIVR